MTKSQYDVAIVGSGAGGAAVAYRLARAGKRVLVIEKGGRLPQDGSTLDVTRVVHEGHFRSRERWRDGGGRPIVPEEYFNVGGKTKWYGAALLRFDAREFDADPAHRCPGWPLASSAIAPYYDELERLLGVREFACEPDLETIIAGIRRADRRWQRAPLPMALAADIADHAREAAHFDGFASVRGLKGDAETGLLALVAELPNLDLATGDPVIDLVPVADSSFRIGGVRLASGRTIRARHVVLAAGALHSPRLLQRYLSAHGLAASLPAAAQIGRNLKLHLLTAMLAVSASRKTDVLRKTTVLTCDDLPHSSVQPLGFDAELIATLVPSFVPRAFATALGARAYGFFLQTEDGSHPDNRVVDGQDGEPPTLDYDARRTPMALREHRALIRRLRGALWRAGFLSVSRRIGPQGTAHACGTLMAGDDPARSVVDRDGRVHGMHGLYVADGSALPRSSRVNPSLTIYAWGLHVADRLLAARGARAAA